MNNIYRIKTIGDGVKQRTESILSGLIIGMALMLGINQVMAATSYTTNGYLVELLPSASGSHYPAAMNDHGAIVGMGKGSGWARNAVIWNEDGSYANLTPDEQSVYSSARGINADGVIVGHFNNRPVIWSNGERVEIGGVAAGYGSADDINALGEVVGQVQINYQPRAFVYQAGESRLLNGLNAYTYTRAYAINNHGLISGTAQLASGKTNAVVWQDDIPTDLGTLPGDGSSYGLDINDAGQVVGYSRTTSYPFRNTPVIWQADGIHSLGGLGGTGGVAKAINNHGQVVGYAYTAQGIQHPFIWQDGVMTDLAPVLQGLCPELATCGRGMAVSINDAGQIVGTIYVAGTYYPQVYRLTPLSGE
ncbi:MAG: hypothetical protein OEY52_13685 [Gammaproteobacteria bacterium]|nr:hypothetical protein [Gammaproteobacteria bacterium]